MDKEKKNLTVFGYGLALILAFVSYRIWHHHGWVSAHALLIVCAVALVIVTAVNYLWLRPVYKKWMVVARFIGAVITGIILSVMFYLVFGITGIILRFLRKDLLDRQIEPPRQSYWIERTSVPFDQSHYTRQF